MRHILPLAALATTLSFGQNPPAVPASPQPQQAAAASAQPTLLTLPPDSVVATIDGQKILALELQTVVRSLQPAQQQAILKDPRGFLEQVGLMRRLSAMAEKGGLDRKSPLREQLEYSRMMALAQAQLSAGQSQVVVKPEEVKKFYDENKDVFTQVRLKVIYLPYSPTAPAASGATDKKILTEAEAKAKAEKLYADIQAGADFVKLVKENSGDPTSAAKDGDFGVFTRSDNIPEDVKTAIFALKAGQVSAPVRQPNGYYLFRAEDVSLQPFEKVESLVTDRLRNTLFNDWVETLRKSIEVKIETPAILPPAPSAAPATK